MSTEIGERIKWARQASGLSVSQAARLMQTSSDMILAIEQGRVTPSFLDLGQFVTLYEVDMDWLRHGVERHVDVPATHHTTDDDRETLRRVLARRRQG